MATARSRLGSAGEKLALAFLARTGCEILHTNFRCRCGEIDIVAREGDCTVFVEVRTRRGCPEISPAESVGPRKQQRLMRAAAEYLSCHDLWDKPCRFDIVEVVLQPDAPADIRVWKGVLEESQVNP